jgi:alkanesulfonate monooxygenase SsuD/methylene tetrahydromethanopterin reductase-like flavin-dependent oxidoreductase (luciferase family)
MRKRFEEVKAQVRLADQLGFSDLLTGMHYAAAPLQQYQMIPLLARLLAETERMRIITGIILLSLHKPLDIAEQLATLDVMSGGRLVFGAGLGYRDVEFKAFGTTAQERVQRLEENLEAIKRLWTEDDVSMKGSHFELDRATVSLKPIQKPHPPIWLGANADVAVRRAARLADTWFINPHQRMDTIERQLSLYKQALTELGKPMPDELPLMREIFVARTRAEAVRLARPYLEEKYKVYQQWGQQKAMPKGDDGLSLAFDELTRDRFLLGSSDEVTEQIVDYNRRLGVNRMILSVHWVGMPHSQVVDTLNLFAPRSCRRWLRLYKEPHRARQCSQQPPACRAACDRHSHLHRRTVLRDHHGGIRRGGNQGRAAQGR